MRRKFRIRKDGLLGRIVRRDLLKNKVYSLILMLIGYFTIHALEGDCTVFMLTLVLGLPVFFAKDNVIC